MLRPTCTLSAINMCSRPTARLRNYSQVSQNKIAQNKIHVLPRLRMVDNLRVRGHSYNLPECSTNVHKKSFVVGCQYGFIKLIGCWFDSVSIPICFCSSLVLVFSCVILLFIAMLCHVSFLCAFVTLNKNTYLLT